MIVVVISSLVIVRRRLPYEWWYAVHFTAYAAIALSWFHEIPTGNELTIHPVAADYWRSLFAATLALLVLFRLVQPLARSLVHGLRVEEVVVEAPGVVSLRIGGRGLERLRARAGQFFLWRFLSVPGRWWEAHPFSLSALPDDGGSLRITVKGVGAYSRRLAEVRPGTRVLAEGPFGTFTDAVRRRDKVLLIAGGIGITPVRTLLEEIDGDVAVLYRVVRDEDVVFREELDALARERGASARVRRRRPRRARRRAPALGGAPARARARRRRARGVSLRPAGDDARDREERARRRRAARFRPCRTVRTLTRGDT